MKNKHTPGRWMVAGRDQNDSIDIKADGLFIAEAIGGLADGEQEANARLIAAAPDLLEVAQRSADALRSVGIEPRATSDNPLGWLLHQTEAAIAKAKGREQQK